MSIGFPFTGAIHWGKSGTDTVARDTVARAAVVMETVELEKFPVRGWAVNINFVMSAEKKKTVKKK